MWIGRHSPSCTLGSEIPTLYTLHSCSQVIEKGCGQVGESVGVEQVIERESGKRKLHEVSGHDACDSRDEFFSSEKVPYAKIGISAASQHKR